MSYREPKHEFNYFTGKYEYSYGFSPLDIFICVFLVVSAIFFGIWGGIYVPFANTTFERIDPKYEVSVFDFKKISCFNDEDAFSGYTYLWTLEMTDLKSNATTYGHACASYFSDDSIAATINYDAPRNDGRNYPYERLPVIDNTLLWFCYHCVTRNCVEFESYTSDLSQFDLHMSRRITHTASLQLDNETFPIIIDAHDVLLEKTPYFPVHDWRALWVFALIFLAVATLYFGFNLVDEIVAPVSKVNFGSNSSSYRNFLYIVKEIEIMIFSACTVCGSIYVFKNVTFNPYTDENVAIIQASFYVWFITITYDVATWICMLPYAEFLCYEKLSWQSGYIPIFGIIFRFMLGTRRKIEMISFHESIVIFHIIFNIPQLVLVGCYCFGESLGNHSDNFDIAYFILLCSSFLIIIIDCFGTIKQYDDDRTSEIASFDKKPQTITHAQPHVKIHVLQNTELATFKTQPDQIDTKHSSDGNAFPTFVYRDTM